MTHEEREQALAVIRKYDGIGTRRLLDRVRRICGGMPHEMNVRRLRKVHPALRDQCIEVIEVCIARIAKDGGDETDLDTCWMYLERFGALGD